MALCFGAAIIAALYFARDILLPLALSILLSFLLAPLVARIERLRIRRAPAVLIAVTLAFGIIGLLGSALFLQVYGLANNLPKYKSNIAAKLEAFHSTDAGIIQNVRDVVANVGHRASPAIPSGDARHPMPSAQSSGPASFGEVQADSGHAAASPVAAPARPMPVEIVSEPSAWQIVQEIVGPLMGPVASAATVLIFVIFILIDRENLRNRFLHLIGSRQLNTTTQALDDAARRVSRFLLMQTIVNSVFGLFIAAGLFLIGVPNAFLWGVLAGAMRFLPYVGPLIAAGIPFLVATAIFPGWTRPSIVLALFVASDLIINNAIEPRLYSAHTGVSTIGILVSAIFWTWLWGPIGLVLSLPLTVCITVLGRHVPHLSFFNKLLGDEDLLPPASRFYQRLLALDRKEAEEIANDFLKNASLESLFDEVLLPALRLAEQDRHHDDLDEVKQQFIFTTMREIAAQLSQKEVAPVAVVLGGSAESEADVSAVPESRTRVVCLPARDEADEVAGFLLAQLLSARGIDIEVMSAQSFSGEMIDHVSEDKHSIVCVSALPPLAAKHVRVLCKRLRHRFPSMKIVVGLWQAGLSSTSARRRLSTLGADSLVATLAAAAEKLANAIATSDVLLAARKESPEVKCVASGPPRQSRLDIARVSAEPEAAERSL